MKYVIIVIFLDQFHSSAIFDCLSIIAYFLLFTDILVLLRYILPHDHLVVLYELVLGVKQLKLLK